MRTVISVTIVIASLAVGLHSQGNQSVAVKGAVIREDGTGIKAAFVLLRDYEPQNPAAYVSDKWETRTEKDGSFSFIVQPGCYDVFVSANALFFPFTQRICIQPQPTPALKIKLKADPHPKLHLE